MGNPLNMLRHLTPILQPFDPAKMTPVDIGLGGPSTEYLATEYDYFGNALNVPTIWWTGDGRPVRVPPENALALLYEWEDAGRGAFPRYESIGAAVEHAMHRSATGGASKSTLYRR